MKKKVLYTVTLVCFSLVASSNRNTADCDARCNNFATSQSLLGRERTAAHEEARKAIPAATGFLPGYSILFN